MPRPRRADTAADTFLSFRVTRAEGEAIRARARASGLSVGVMLRGLAGIGAAVEALPVEPVEVPALPEVASAGSAERLEHVEPVERSPEHAPRLSAASVPALPRSAPDVAALLLAACPRSTYILDAWSALGEPATLDAFKAAILNARRAGLLSLARGDANHPSAAQSVVRYVGKAFDTVGPPL